MPDSWQNLLVTISNATPKGKLCFEDVSNSLLNEEMHRKSMGEVMPNMEAPTRGGHGRKPYQDKSRRSISRGRSNYRCGGITCYCCGKQGHIEILKNIKRITKGVKHFRQQQK